MATTILDTFVTLFEYKVEGADNLKKMQRIADGIGKAGQKMTLALTAPITALGALSVKAASDMEETQNKVSETFKTSSDAVRSWAENSIQKMGLARQSALDTAALFGDMGVGMGMTEDAAADMATSLTQLSADIASFKNVRQDVAQTALAGVFTGETESLKRLGVVMTEANLKLFAQRKGLNDNLKEMTQLEKIQLRYKFILESTANAQGDFERTGGGAANQMRMFQENIKEFNLAIGENLLPVFTKGIQKLNKALISLTEWWRSLSPAVQKSVLIFAGVVALIGPLLMGLSSLMNLILMLRSVYLIMTAAQWSLNLAMLANPVGLIIAAVIALIAWFAAAALKTGSFTGALQLMASQLIGVGQRILKFLILPTNLLIDNIVRLIRLMSRIPGAGKLKGVADSIEQIQDKVNLTLTGSSSTNPFAKREVDAPFNPLAAAPAPAAAPASVLAGGRGGGTQDNRSFDINVDMNVNEASDGKAISEQFARELQTSLRNATQNFETKEAVSG